MTKVMKRLLIVLAAASGLAAALIVMLALPQSVRAGGGCVDAYTVQRGDTLSGIAFKLGIPYRDLLAANRQIIANPDRIYTGQMLCLPGPGDAPRTSAGPGPDAEELGPAGGPKVALEGWYVYTPTDEEDALQLARNGLLSKRIELPLQPAKPATVFTQTGEITPVLAAGTPPVLVGVRNGGVSDPEVVTYTLVAIGAGQELLARLALSNTVAITPSTALSQSRPIAAFLGDPALSLSSLWLMAETPDGVRTPFEVSHVDVVPDYAHFKQLYLDARPGDAAGRIRADDIGFALFPLPTGDYQLLLRLQGGVLGPPNWTTRVRCQAWRPRRGVWYWFLRSFYGC